MLKALGERLTYANVMSTIAVFVALGGGAYAVSLGKGDVKAKNIARDAVRAKAIKEGAVRTAEIRDRSVGIADTAGELRLRCPKGTVLISASCMETDARAPENWGSTTCLDEGFRMPSVEELQAARSEPAITLSNLEWSGITYVYDKFSGGEEYRALAVADGGGISPATLNTAYPYRCMDVPKR